MRSLLDSQEDETRNLLFTPGPLNCHEEVHAAMQTDVGSRDDFFLKTIQKIRRQLLQICDLDANDGYTAIPVQGSGTFGLESALTTLIGPQQKLLILENGAYGKRIREIGMRASREVETYSVPPTERHDPEVLRDLLQTDPSISHVAIVHCETTTGIVNPLPEMAAIAKEAGKSLLVDAMSSFGAIPIDFKTWDIDCLVSSPNKCLESVPGFSFAIVKESSLSRAQGNCPSLSLDLYDQWTGLESTGQFRFTPPTHCLLAFDKALDLFFSEGGIVGRGNRYRNNHETLISGMKALGFEPVLEASLQSPIITSFPFPEDPAFNFEDFYRNLARQGLTIYPGKLENLNSFRIGTIGQLFPDDIKRLLDEIATLLPR